MDDFLHRHTECVVGQANRLPYQKNSAGQANRLPHNNRKRVDQFRALTP
jgi:hypothetical protein